MNSTDKALALREWNRVHPDTKVSLGLTKQEFMREFPKELALVRKLKRG